MKERELRDPVADYFLRQGYECAFERSFPSGYCDVLAFRFAPQTSRRIPELLEVIAVELKLDRIAQALSQARGYAWCGARSFVAMPEDRCRKMKPQTIERFRKQNIGLLSVNGSVEMLVNADYWPDGCDLPQQEKLWRIHKRLHATGLA